MNNQNEQQGYNREVRQDTYTDANGQTYTNVTRTTETSDLNPNSYQDGYINGQVSERRYQEENLAARDNSSAASGLVVGIFLTALVGLIAGGIWFFTQRDEAAKHNATPTAAPTTSRPSPQASQTPQKQTTIIERTKEVPVPVERTKEVPVPIFVPQPQSSASSAPTQNLRDNSSSSQPTANPTPSVQQNSTQSNSNRNNVTQGTQDNPTNTNGQTDTSSSSSNSDSTGSSSK